ncbi:MAG: glycoside hydrolase, partial [Terracidiphilus sp.]
LYSVVDDLGTGIARGFRSLPGAEKTPAPKPSGGVYVSNDAGATWKLVNSEKRLWGRGWYFGQISVDPTNPDRAYDINTATYMTLDAGKTWVPVKGAPGGDDYHQLWINPKDGSRMVLSSDQGTVVSVDGAKTWSTWYNQPTAQIYHIAADNRFPYWLYGAQQDSGAVGVSTWSRTGTLNFRNWEPICEAGESSTVVPDPDDGKLLYGNGDQRCNQELNLPAPAGGELPAADPNDPNRKTWTLPQVFSLADKALYYSNQFVFRTRDRGKTWTKISPDLTRLRPEVPKTLDSVTGKDIDEPMTDHFGVVYTISPSPLDAKMVWVGTDDGLIHVTRDDGANWKDVTPPTLSAWSKVSQIEAGHFDIETAYASVDRHRLADDRPYIYRTHDGGKSWENIVDGIPDGAFVNSVKEDTKQKGLLYAATELRVYVSFDDGDRWQALQLNMPVTSIRDIVVHDDDLAIATFGRGFWVLDQMAVLRQIAERGKTIEDERAYLYAPGETFAIHQGGQNGTPLPREEPQELNPPAGVVAYYWLKSPPAGPLTIELVDAKGNVSACVASDTPVKPVDTEAINVQAYWLEPMPPPPAEPGMHRVALNVVAPRAFGGGRNISPPPEDACHPSGTAAAKPAKTTARPGAGTVGLQPGNYTVRFTVDKQTFSQPVTVKPDPRRLPKGADASPEEDTDE